MSEPYPEPAAKPATEQPESRFLLEGLELLGAGETVEAIATFGAGLAEYSNSLSLRENRARAWMLAGHHAKALADLDFALDLALKALEDPEVPPPLPTPAGLSTREALAQQYRDLRRLTVRLELARGVCWAHTGSEQAAQEAFVRLLTRPSSIAPIAPKGPDAPDPSKAGTSGDSDAPTDLNAPGASVSPAPKAAPGLETVDAHLEAEARCAWAAVLASREAFEEGYREAVRAAELAPEDRRYQALKARLEELMSARALNGRIGGLEEEISELLAGERAQEALPLLEELRDLTGESAQLLQWYGAAYHLLGRYEEELEMLNRSHELDGNEVALFNRAVCYLKQDRKEEARRDFQAVADRSRESGTVAYAKAMVTILTQPSEN